jgi:hypothetical protein
VGIFTDLSQLFVTGVNYADEQIKQSLNDQINAEHDQAFREFAGESTASTEADPSVFGTDPGATKEAVPKEVSTGLKDAERIQTARAQGALDENTYWVRMQTLTKQLRSRYPGHRDYIDDRVAKITGGRPANEIMRNIQAQQASAQAAARQEENAKLRLIEDWTEKGVFESPEEIQAAASMPRLEILTKYGSDASRKARIELLKSSIELEEVQGKRADRLNMEAAQAEVEDIVITALDKSKPGGKLTPWQEMDQTITGLMQAGAKATGEQVALVTQQFAATKKQYLDMATGKLAAYKGLTSEQRKQALAPLIEKFDEMEKYLTDNNWGMIKMTYDKLERAKRDNAVRFLETHPVAGEAAAIDSVLGQGPMGNLYAMLTMEQSDLGQRALTEYNIKSGSSRANHKVLPEQIEEGVRRGFTPAQSFQNAINVQKTILFDKGADKDNLEQAAKTLFSPGAYRLMDQTTPVKVGKDGQVVAQGAMVLRELVNPQMTARMEEIKSIAPQAYQYYQDFAKASFHVLFRKSMSDVASWRADADEWNNPSPMFSVGGVEFSYAPASRKRDAPVWDANASQFVMESGSPVKNATITNLNAAIQGLKEVLKPAGININDFLAQQFEDVMSSTSPLVRKMATEVYKSSSFGQEEEQSTPGTTVVK